MRQTIDIPPPNAIVIFRGDDGKVYFLNSEAKVYLTESYHGVHRIVNPSFTSYNQITGEQIEVIKSTSQEFIFALYRSTQTIISKGGGKKGISGIIVEDEDINLGTFQILNFEGAGVIVTNDGGGKATVTIGGGGMIFGAGTPNRLAMFTAPNTIGDSPFLRSGSDVITDAFLYFNSGFGIDVLATGGADVLNIGTTNADVINYGYAGTTHNMNGTVFNVFTTNLNVTDKIITLNDGGAAGSGGNVGFEIEEGGVATGYFIQNTTRDGFDFQASAVTGVATFDLSLLTGNQTATLQDASGTIAYLSDIPAPVAAFVQNGNSFGAPAVLGTNDVFSLSFETSGTTRGTISSGGLWGINTAPVAGTLVTVQSTGITSATWIEQWYNATPTLLFGVRDDGYITAGLPNGSMTIGLSSAFDPTLVSNTYIGVDVGNLGERCTALGHSTLTVNTANDITAIGFQALSLNTSGQAGVAVGRGALASNTTGGNCVAIGVASLGSQITGSDNVAIGTLAFSLNDNIQGVAIGNEAGLSTTGRRNTIIGWRALFGAGAAEGNVAIGWSAMIGTTTASESVAVGFQSLATMTTGGAGAGQNTAIGAYAGISTNGFRNLFLGKESGYYSNENDAFYVHNSILGITTETEGKERSMIYGKFSQTLASQFMRFNCNLGLYTSTFGTNAEGVLGLANATAPTTSVVNQIQLFSVDSSDVLATLGLFTEQSVEAVAAVPDARLKVWLNLAGTLTEYYLALEAV